jgi:hypothetical protein
MMMAPAARRRAEMTLAESADAMDARAANLHDLSFFCRSVLRMVFASYPDDPQARGEDAYEVATSYRPESWPDGDFVLRDWLQDAASDLHEVPSIDRIRAAMESTDIVSHLSAPLV